MKKININKIVAVFLPISWFIFLWYMPEFENMWLRFPLCIFIGFSMSTLWRIESDKKEAVESAVMKEKYIQFCEKYNIEPKPKT